MQSPTARTLEALRDDGYTCQTVEQFIPRLNIRRDLFGCIDVIAVRPGEVLGVQATSASHHAERVKKALAEPRLSAWLQSGALFAVWSWAKRAGRWTCRKEIITPKQNNGGMPCL